MTPLNFNTYYDSIDLDFWRELILREGSTLALFDNTYDRYIDLRIKSAKERYMDLIYRHKDLLTMFSLKDIASFLNITPTHLSRIRKF